MFDGPLGIHKPCVMDKMGSIIKRKSTIAMKETKLRLRQLDFDYFHFVDAFFRENNTLFNKRLLLTFR